MSLNALRKAVKKSAKNRDDFSVGTVIRWLASGTYVYAAVKSPVGWFTTSTGNAYIEQVLTFEELLEILGRAETSEVMVVSTWTLLSEGGDIVVDGDEARDEELAAHERSADGRNDLLTNDLLTVGARDVNVQAQRFYEIVQPSLTSMLEKPRIVEGLRAVLTNLGFYVEPEDEGVLLREPYTHRRPVRDQPQA